METQAQTGRAVKVCRKPKARPPRTNVLTMKAIRNARLACLSPEFMFALINDYAGLDKLLRIVAPCAISRKWVVVGSADSASVVFGKSFDALCEVWRVRFEQALFVLVPIDGVVTISDGDIEYETVAEVGGRK